MRINILDVNDNKPKFDDSNSKIIAAVPTTAEYGHHVSKIQVNYCTAEAQPVPYRLNGQDLEDFIWSRQNPACKYVFYIAFFRCVSHDNNHII